MGKEAKVRCLFSSKPSTMYVSLYLATILRATTIDAIHG